MNCHGRTGERRYVAEGDNNAAVDGGKISYTTSICVLSLFSLSLLCSVHFVSVFHLSFLVYCHVILIDHDTGNGLSLSILASSSLFGFEI